MGSHKMVTIILSIIFALQLIEARPPQQGRGGAGPQNPATNDSSDWNLGLEYNRYLQEVVQVLESDPEFRKKLETADVEKIRDGSIANELEMVNHQIRNQLDDIKRRELERLRHLAMRQYEMQNGIDKRHIKFPQHIEIQHPRFEIEDLRKLIKTTTKDLEEADKKRRTDFKRYEMEKKFEHEQRLQHIEDEERRKEEEQRMMEQDRKHREHGKVNHPMTKDQLEGVWEGQDHMRAQDWDPKTFFAMHDLNGDRFWDEDEVRVLFKKELDKVYDPNAPEDDMREREEEMERMREHVFKESDTDKDRLISFQEFLAETKREEFEKDPGWETMDQAQDTPFTDEEFKAYEMQRMREIQGMINRGVVPEGYPYYGGVPPGAPIHPQLGGQQPYMPGGGNPNLPLHPGQMPPQYVGQGQEGMNVQPLRGEQNYRQPLPQFAGAQPQNQFGQQQFGSAGGQPKQAFGQGQQQQFANVPKQQFDAQQQQQQNFDRGQAKQSIPQQQQQQQFAVPRQQPVEGGQISPVESVGGKAPPPQKPVEAVQSQEVVQPPQPRGQPVLRAQKPVDIQGQPQQQQQHEPVQQQNP